MRIYKFLQHGEWPVLIMAKTKEKADIETAFSFAIKDLKKVIGDNNDEMV